MQGKKTFFFIALYLIYLAAYGNVALRGRFLWDDKPLILESPYLQGKAPVRDIFAQELYPLSRTNYYRPLLLLSFLADHALFGFNPRGFHATNILLHGLTAFLFFLFCRALTCVFFCSFVATAIFLLHPIHVQVVSYISGRADSLCSLLIFSSLCSYLIFLKDGKKTYAAAVLFFILSLFVKEMAVVLPLAVFALDVFCGSPSGRVRRLLPFFLAAFVYAVLRMSVLNFSVGNPFLAKEGFGFSETALVLRACLYFKTLALYIGAFFVPFDLHMERLIAFEHIRLHDAAGILFFLWAAVFALRHSLRGKTFVRVSALFAGWFLIWLLPQSAFVFPGIMAEHFLYLPSMSLCFLLGFCADVLRRRCAAGPIFLAGLAFYFGAMTYLNNFYWLDELVFFKRTLELSPRAVRARDSLASLYVAADRLGEALAEYKTILDPDDELKKEQDFGIFADAILERTGESRDKKEMIAKAAAFHNSGVIYEKMGEALKAFKAYQCAITLNPELSEAYSNLGLLFEVRGQSREAEAAYRRVMAADPGFLAAYNNLARLYARQGRMEEALSLWYAALRINPGYDIARKNIQIVEELHRERK